MQLLLSRNDINCNHHFEKLSQKVQKTNTLINLLPHKAASDITLTITKHSKEIFIKTVIIQPNKSYINSMTATHVMTLLQTYYLPLKLVTDMCI